jgi:anti-sigma regulatory factor (Ser/Thr protein kinase)
MSLAASRNLRKTYAAVPASIPPARRQLIRFAAAAGAGRDRLEAIRLAASEALTNVVQHAYRDRSPGPVEVVAAVVDNELWVLVADEGCGLKPRADSPGLGMGLALIGSVTDGMVVVTRSCGGTEVRMRFSLRPSEHPPSTGPGGPASARAVQPLGSEDSATAPASSSFSTTM